MDKKALISELKGINATNPINAIIPSYCGEWDTTHCNFNFYMDDDNDSLDLYIYTDYESLIKDAFSSLRLLDLTAGADDQFYDYNLSCFESLIYAAHQMQPLDRAAIYQELLSRIKDLETWAQDPNNNDDGMLNTYQSEQRYNIEANSLQGLEGYELYTEIKQSL